MSVSIIDSTGHIVLSELFELLKSGNTITKQEGKICCLLCTGLSYKEVANSMQLSINTIKFYINSIYKKLSINNRTELMKISILYGGFVCYEK